MRRDATLALQGNRYQVDPHLAGRTVELRFDPAVDLRRRSRIGEQIIQISLLLCGLLSVLITAGIVVVLPEMDDLVDHAGVAYEVADKVLVVPPFSNAG